ncbi:family S53 protease-like protein [Favolaschia claudopus]|uniref:tripeptidyl-peptidase II n=1 Tax=Favolaschia claudopus TaxID=2862362 RepID=A0AAW0CEH6_9AGAR
MFPHKALYSFFAILSTVYGSLVLHEHRDAAPSGFVNHGSAPATDMLTLRFALTPQNLNGLHQKFMSISTPENSDYREWLSKEAIKPFIQPSDETVAAFNSFAAKNGLQPTTASPNGDWVTFTMTVGQANRLFGAQYQKFSHSSLPKPIMRTFSISLPAELVGKVEVIHPSTSFVGGGPGLATAPLHRNDRWCTSWCKSLPACNSSVPEGKVTPSCLQKFYGIPSTPATQKNNKILVPGYVGRTANRTDLETFLKQFRSDISPNTTFDLLTIDDNANRDAPPGDSLVLEANLDVQYTVGLATGVPVEFLSVGGPSDEDFVDGDLATGLLDTATFLEGVENPPSVVSTSVGLDEAGVEKSLAKKICDSYMVLGARGMSVLFAAGDGGVRGSHDNSSAPGVCESNAFLSVFPASCPYVTTVGATQGFLPEISANLTGGGFSNLFPQPWYQKQAVGRFLTSLPRDFVGTFNKTGRGYPDVAAQGFGLQVVFNGGTLATGGTSFSSPIFSSIIALINDRLVAAGKPVLGFLNPWIYANPEAFTDITQGHNSGFTCPASSSAFDATKGWDPLSGLGSPVFRKMLAAAFDC